MKTLIRNKEIVIFYLLIIGFSFFWVWRIDTLKVSEKPIVNVEQIIKLNV